VPDPVGGLHFRVQLTGGPTIGWFTECSGLAVEYEVMDYEEGGENTFVHHFRGRAKYPNLVLKRGITHERALLDWFLQCQTQTARAQIDVSLLGPGATSAVRAWSFWDAFPVKWAGPTLNAGSSSIATETLEIAHHGLKT
jgi:phage tail-like protein